jgi:hypothetical protein
MPRIRFTIRRMMIAVLVAALAAWWFVGRPASFLRTASYHRDQYRAHTTFHEERNGSREEADIQLSRSLARTNRFGGPHSPKSIRISSFGRLVRDGISRASPTCDRRHP